ncbi:MAG: M12 family metallo-peptidase [Bacteroidales bacterium]|nr:M12 family metallo-peptidase [Bacteroidales bacterium]
MSGRSVSAFDQYLSAYTVFTMDKRELLNELHTNKSALFQIRINDNLSWTFDMVVNDMRAPSFRQVVVTDEGEFECNNFVLNTFKGETSDGRVARFTIDENTFFGVILGENYHYMIRSARDYTRNADDRRFIVYKSWDVIATEREFDFINDALIVSSDGGNEIASHALDTPPPCAYILRIATDADFEFYQLHGSNTNNHIRSILNMVEGVYQSAFGMRFMITFQAVVNRPNHLYTSTNAGTLLNEFRNYWNANRRSVERNIAHLFTNKNLNYLGYAFVGQINGNANNNWAYALSGHVNHSNRLHEIVAHEIGHNLNAGHPSTNTCGCDDFFDRSIMCPQLSIFPSTNLWFCQQSRIEINMFIRANRRYLITVCGHMAVCNSGIFTINIPGGHHHHVTWGVTPANLFSVSPATGNWTNVTVLNPGWAHQGVLTATVRNVIGDVVMTKTIMDFCEPPICDCPPDGDCTCDRPWNFIFTPHPNPVSDVLIIDLTPREADVFRTRISAETAFNIRLLNAHGIVVRQQRTQASTIQFDVSQLPEGTYYLHIEHGGEIEKHQIIVWR